jgi:hypothetical protein
MTVINVRRCQWRITSAGTIFYHPTISDRLYAWASFSEASAPARTVAGLPTARVLIIPRLHMLAPGPEPGPWRPRGGLVGARGGRDSARPCHLVVHGAASVLGAFAEVGHSHGVCSMHAPGVGPNLRRKRSYVGSTVELESDLGLPGQAKQVYYAWYSRLSTQLSSENHVTPLRDVFGPLQP